MLKIKNLLVIAGYLTADLVGHEFTHSVERTISGMTYRGESGAIMEALSDVYGELIEDWNNKKADKQDHELDGDCDWVNAYRNMINPAEKNCPLVYKGDNYYTEEEDHGGVHKNSTVISHAAYLMTHPSTKKFVPLTNSDLAKLLYKSMNYLPTDCTFEQFATHVCLAAEELDISEEKQKTIVQSFHEVGLEANTAIKNIEGKTRVYGTVATVEDNDGKKINHPVENVTLTVINTENDTAITGMKTNETGSFEFYLEEGSYSIVAEAEGFINSTTSFEIDSDEEMKIKIKLQTEIVLDKVKAKSCIEEFLVSGEYKKYMSEFIDDSNLEYVIFDINSDDIPELIIDSRDGTSFYTTWIFVFDGDSIILADEQYGYGTYSYSPSQNAVIGSPEFRPFAGTSYAPFYRLVGTKFEFVFQIGQDEGAWYYSDGTNRRLINDEERDSYFNDKVWFDWMHI